MPDHNEPNDPATICRRFELLKGNRGVWESLWQVINDLVNPTTDFTSFTVQGIERRRKMYDSTAPDAADTLASALHSLITNPATQWMYLTVLEPQEDLDEEGQRWLQDRSMDLLNFYSSARSGANTMFMEVYQNIVSFGTAPFVRKSQGPGKMPKYFSVPLSNLFLDGDESGDVVGVYRLIEYDPRDLVKDFGLENVSDEASKLARGADTSRKVAVIHAVFKVAREYPDGGSPFKLPWASVYVERATKHKIREGGFNHNPYHTPRWSRNPGEVYGRSPAMAVLNAIKLVNVMSRDTIIAGELKVRPPMMIPANSMEGPVRTAPGSMNYYQMGSRDRPEPMNTGADPSTGVSMIELVKQDIRQGFFNDLLRLPDTDRMTALEVSVRTSQKLQVMSPILSRMTAEMLGPMIKSDYDLMLSIGMFPPAPDSMKDKEIKVEYRSPMAVAQQASQANNLLQLMGVATPLINADPRIMRRVDGPATMKALALNMNATLLRFRDDAEVDAEEKQERDAALRAAGASTAKDLGSASKDAATAVTTVAGSEGLALAR